MASQPDYSFLAEDGEVRHLIQTLDWTTTPLGSPATWPQSLKTVVRLALNTHEPTFILWGQAGTCLYNDACSLVLGPERHPDALGKPGREVWKEIWPVIGLQFDIVMSGQRTNWQEQQPAPFTWHNQHEGTWWTYSLCPVDDQSAPGGIGGVLVFCKDVTEKRRVYETIRMNKTWLRALFNSDVIGFSIFDANSGRTIEVNDRALELMDSTREEFETGTRDWRSATAPEELELDERAMRQIIETGRADAFEKTFIRKDGSRVHVRLSAAPMPHQPGYVVIAVEDLTARRAVEAALRRSEDHLQLAQEAGEVGTWEWDVTSGTLYWSESCHKLHGTDPVRGASFEIWREGIDPADWPLVEAAIQKALTGDERAWRVEFRFRRVSDGSLRWLAGRGEVVRDPVSGRVVRIFGVGMDVTERRDAEERLRLVARELDHRAKNSLAVVLAALRLTPKDEPKAYARAVEGRVKALARAHGLLAQDRWAGANLRDVLEGELAPFLADHRTDLIGPQITLPATATQPLTMAVHELATNAVKHGALSIPKGRISISWHSENQSGHTVLRLRWAELGGPPIQNAPKRQGFGSRVLDSTVRGQLGGKVSLYWQAAGLVCDLEVPLTRTALFSTDGTLAYGR